MLKKNRILVLLVSVIVLSGVYYGVQKAIDAYNFDTDIVYVEDDVAVSKGEAEGGTSGQITEDEVDLELEATEDGEDEEGIVDEREGAIGDASRIEDGEDKAEASGMEEKIYVYITGEVNAPGVVILNKGSRIVDAINAVGGTTVKANVTKVNLVYVLEDGMKVNIPSSSDLKDWINERTVWTGD